MKTTRSLAIGLTAALVLGLSGTALAAQAPATREAQVVHRTQIRFLPVRHIHPAGGTLYVRGQVASTVDGQTGALAGVTVKFYRQLHGNSNWVYAGTRTTGDGDFPGFTFSAKAGMNAHYKAVFVGNANFRPSQKSTYHTVYRLFNATITDGRGAATLRGHVTPLYTHKPIALQKRSCATCRYVTVKRTVSGTGGAYSFSLQAPPHGFWWWRVSIPGTVWFMPSFSATFSTKTT